MMARKIAKIETFVVPPRWLFVRVEDEDGAFGWGEASLEGHAEAVDGAFEPLLDRFIGHDPRRIEDIWQVAYRGGFYRGGPVLLSALSGLDQALWDLKGKLLGVPAYELLGGSVRDRIRAYAWIGGDRPDDIAEAAAARREQGFTAIKMNATPELDWLGTPKLFADVVKRVEAAQGEGMVQKTEQIVGPYELHDFFLYYFLRFGFSPAKILRLADAAFAGAYAPEEVEKRLREFLRRFFAAQFKRSCLPDGPKVGSVALSPRGDWRMPSDAAARAWLENLDAAV